MTFKAHPRPSDLIPLTHDLTRARVLERLLFRHPSTRFKDDHGRPVQIINLREYAEALGKSRSAVCRAFAWLAKEGLLMVQRVKRGRFWRLQVRPLIRPRAPSETPDATVGATVDATVKPAECNGDATVNIYSGYSPDTQGYRASAMASADDPSDSGGDSPRKGPTPQTPLPERKRFGIRGKVSEAADRAKALSGAAREKRRGDPLKPRAAAMEWNALLREWGDTPFVIEGKTLGQVKLVLGKMNARSLDEFRARLDAAFGRFYANRPADAKKAPAHPWVLNRHFHEYFAKQTATVTVPKDIKSKTEAKTVAPPPASTPFKSKSKFLQLLKANKKGYKAGEPPKKGE